MLNKTFAPSSQPRVARTVPYPESSCESLIECRQGLQCFNVEKHSSTPLRVRTKRLSASCSKADLDTWLLRNEPFGSRKSISGVGGPGPEGPSKQNSRNGARVTAIRVTRSSRAGKPTCEPGLSRSKSTAMAKPSGRRCTHSPRHEVMVMAPHGAGTCGELMFASPPEVTDDTMRSEGGPGGQPSRGRAPASGRAMWSRRGSAKWSSRSGVQRPSLARIGIGSIGRRFVSTQWYCPGSAHRLHESRITSLRSTMPMMAPCGKVLILWTMSRCQGCTSWSTP